MFTRQNTVFARVLAALCAAVLIAVATLAQAQSGDLTASVDRQEISVEETLTLSVRYSGQVMSGEPDFSLLNENFDILSRQQSNQIRAINGVVNSFTEWTLTIAPKGTGELLIPSFEYNGAFSDAIQITVTKATAPPGQLKDIFIETEISQPQIFVQQQLILTYRLYTTRSIDSMDAEPLKIDGVTIEELPQTRYQRRIDGINYGVLEVAYALFPQTSDNFTVPPLRWTLSVVTSGNRHGFPFGANRYELQRLLTGEKEVQVKPRPESYPAGATWLPARKVVLSEKWSSPPSEFRVGEPLTRTITLRAQGLTAAQLPPLPLGQNSKDFKLYADQPQLDNTADANGITGVRVESMAVVPTVAGEMTLPAIKISWWDTQSQSLRTAELPERTFYVQGGADQTEPQEAPESEPAIGRNITAEPESTEQVIDEVVHGQPLFWQLATAIFALLWLIFAWLWWRKRAEIASIPGIEPATNPQPATAMQEKQAFKALQAASRRQDLMNLRQRLLHWGTSRWRHHPPRSLQELASLLDQQHITQQLDALDATLYGQKDATVDAGKLVEDIDKWRAQQKPTEAQTRKNLKPLY